MAHVFRAVHEHQGKDWLGIHAALRALEIEHRDGWEGSFALEAGHLYCASYSVSEAGAALCHEAVADQARCASIADATGTSPAQVRYVLGMLASNRWALKSSESAHKEQSTFGRYVHPHLVKGAARMIRGGYDLFSKILIEALGEPPLEPNQNAPYSFAITRSLLHSLVVYRSDVFPLRWLACVIDPIIFATTGRCSAQSPWISAVDIPPRYAMVGSFWRISSCRL